MKKLIVELIVVLLVMTALLFANCKAYGQTTNQIPNFFNQVATWGTSFNTNADHSWDASTISLDTGIATVTGIGISDRLNADYSISKFSLGAMAQFEGVGSAISELEATAKFALVQKYDFKFGLTFGAGCDFNNIATGRRTSAAVFEPGLFASKIMTASTYATTSLTVPIETRGKFNTIPTLYVGMGARF